MKREITYMMNAVFDDGRRGEPFEVEDEEEYDTFRKKGGWVDCKSELRRIETTTKSRLLRRHKNIFRVPR